ncbi:hypothetical protein ACJ72_08013, partial [Emergomyces africanus]
MDHSHDSLQDLILPLVTTMDTTREPEGWTRISVSTAAFTLSPIRELPASSKPFGLASKDGFEAGITRDVEIASPGTYIAKHWLNFGSLAAHDWKTQSSSLLLAPIMTPKTFPWPEAHQVD